MVTKSKLALGSESIEEIVVGGFKSLHRSHRVKIAPLTILSGANSAGKSTLMQPVLLLKQTLEATYDPGPLLLSGPNLHFTSSENLFSVLGKRGRASQFHVGVSVGDPDRRGSAAITSFFSRTADGLVLEGTDNKYDGHTVSINERLDHDLALTVLPEKWKDLYNRQKKMREPMTFFPRRNRCFWELWYSMSEAGAADEELEWQASRAITSTREAYAIKHIIHVPGLRGNPARAYPVSAVGLAFPGTFEAYAASVIADWQKKRNDEKLKDLREDFKRLGLSWNVKATPINETQVELRVGRLTRAKVGGARDLVNIADVGFGVSQVLPVIVALQVAEPGQLVYIEQPEIHLHPRAQVAMAEILLNASARGVRVVVETHSSLVILAIQTLIAEERFSSKEVKLHWFTRDLSSGLTSIRSADLDEKGAFGDWPEDFGEVILQAEGRYLDAVEKPLRDAYDWKDE